MGITSAHFLPLNISPHQLFNLGKSVTGYIDAIDCVNQTEGLSLELAQNYINSLANKANISQQDLIVLSGVFSEKARTVIINQLEFDFPYHLSPENVLGDGPGNGYLLLSKIALDPIIPHLSFREPRIIGDDYITDPESLLQYKDKNDHFFGTYHHGTKGTETGLLGVRVQFNGAPAYLFFSDISTFSRNEAQLQNIQKAEMLLRTVNEWERDSERIFFFVNTDIDGQQATLSRTDEGRYIVNNRPNSLTADEYLNAFGNGYFIHDIFDVWPAIAPHEDFGKTRPIEYEASDFSEETLADANEKGRFTMMFVEPSIEAGCVQHPKHYAMAGSENDMLTFDFAGYHEFCTPADADKLTNNLSHSTSPRHNRTYSLAPGHAVWTLVESENPETISVRSFSRTPNQDTKSEVYAAHNITKPLIPFDEDPERGLKYSVLEKFYIKTYFTDTAKMGEIDVIIQRHDCRSELDSCLLMPNGESNSVKPVFPSTFGDLEQRDFYYDLRFTQSDQFDLDQKLEFKFENVSDHFIKYELLEKIGDSALAPVMGFSEGTMQFGYHVDDVILSGIDRLGGEYFLKITVDQRQTYNLIAKMYTDISIIQGTEPMSFEEKTLEHLENGESYFKLVCSDETNPDEGSDEMSAYFSVDDNRRREVLSRDYECNEEADPYSFWTENRGFKGKIKVTLIEHDDFSGDDKQIRVIEKLNFDQHSKSGKLSFTGHGGHYIFDAKITSRLDTDELIKRLRKEFR